MLKTIPLLKYVFEQPIIKSQRFPGLWCWQNSNIDSVKTVEKICKIYQKQTAKIRDVKMLKIIQLPLYTIQKPTIKLFRRFRGTCSWKN